MNPKKPPPPSELPPPSRAAEPPGDPHRSPDAASALHQALPFILRFARARGFDPSQQQDIAQDVAEWLLRNWHRYDPGRGTPLQWAVGVGAIHVHHAHRRVARERRYIEDDPPFLPDREDPDLTPEQLVRARETLAIVQEVLSPEEQAIFELRARHWTAAEIGEALGLSRGRVEQLTREARVRLVRRLRQLDENPDTAGHVRGFVLPLVLLADLELADLEEVCPRPEELERRGRRLATWSARAGVSMPQLVAGALLVVVLLAGALVVMSERMVTRERPDSLAAIVREDAEIGPEQARDSIAARAAATATVAATAREDANATAPSRPLPAVAGGLPRRAAASPQLEASGTLLLLRAAKLPADDSLAAALLHARQFPTQSPGRREKLLSRARDLLGRSGTSAARDTGLKGTLYEGEESAGPRSTARQDPRAR